jgi:RNA polymerase sigma-70 factor (ECF subfamily)
VTEPVERAAIDSASVALERAGTGDQAAFATLYDEVAGVVHGTIRRVLRDDAMAQEVTQEVFVEVWRTASSFDSGRGTARSWILTMARRRAIDRVRSEEAARRRDLDDARQQRVVAPGADEAVTASSEANRLRDALAELGDPHQKAIELAYFGGLTYREVAAHLGEPEGTIKTRIRDGMNRLRRTLEANA